MKRTLNLFGCMLIAATTLAQDRVYPYFDGHKWGLTNENLEILALPQFDEDFKFNAGLTGALVSINKKWGIINKQGKIVIPCKYDSLGRDITNYMLARSGNTSTLIHRQTGKEAVPGVVFDEIVDNCYCPENYMSVTVKGKIKIVSLNTGRFSNTSTYDEAMILQWGGYGGKTRALVKTGGKYGVLEIATNKQWIPIVYDEMSIVKAQGETFLRAVKAGSVSFFNEDGNTISVTLDEFPNSGDEGLVAPPVEESHSATAVLSPFVYDLGNGNWKITNEKRSLNNKTEILETYELSGYSTIIPLEISWHAIKSFQAFKAVKNGKTGIIEKDGKVLVPFEYDNIEFLRDWYITTLNGKKGVLQNDLSLMKKPVLKNIRYHEASFYVELFSGEKGQMNIRTGKIYIPGVKE